MGFCTVAGAGTLGFGLRTDGVMLGSLSDGPGSLVGVFAVAVDHGVIVLCILTLVPHAEVDV